MYLSDRDLRFVLVAGQLLCDPLPLEIDTTSIDLHLDKIESAKVRNVRAFALKQEQAGNPAILSLGKLNLKVFAEQFAIPVPGEQEVGPEDKVYRDGTRVIVKPGGFFLWQTREIVGTPEIDPRLICFVNGKSTLARTGLVVHMTAPTLHAGWWGQVILEIGNLGPFTFALQEGDAIAQVVVATISSPPTRQKSTQGISIGQREVTGSNKPPQGG